MPGSPEQRRQPDGTPSALDSTRKLLTASQVCAIVSLIFGGVLLSGVSVGLSIYGYTKLKALSSAGGKDQQDYDALARLAKRALAMGAIALALNAISLAIWYPAVMSYVQNMAQPVSGIASSASSVWG